MIEIRCYYCEGALDSSEQESELVEWDLSNPLHWVARLACGECAQKINSANKKKNETDTIITNMLMDEGNSKME